MKARGLLPVAIALAVAVLAAGCGRGSAPPSDGAIYGEDRPATTADELHEAAGDGSTGDTAGPPIAGGGASGPGSKPPSDPTATTRGSAPRTAGDSGPGITAASRGGPGSFGPVLLQPQPATRLIIELLQQPGADPYTPALDRLAATLREVTGKPVSRPAATRVDSSATAHSAADIRAIADSQGTRQSGGQAVMHVLYLNGRFADNENVLGVAVRGDVMAIFPDVIATAATALVPARVIEDAVVMHEAGHLLGLVDLVINTGRADRDHPGHSRSRGSVMYWAVESSLVATLLDGPPPREFDADDRRDLAAIRDS